VEDRTEDNFGNQAARDYLAVLTARLLATIREVTSDDDRLDPDEDGESLLMPAVEVLALLCERYGAEPPRPAAVRQWHGKYLAAFDAGRGEMGVTPEFAAARRKVIENTFRWLEGLADSYHSA
jgi:hypothetical protein